MNLLDEQYREFVQPTTLTKKLTLNGETKAYPIYRVRLELLYYNDQNDRIATWISQYKSEQGGFHNLSKEAYNAVIEDFIIKSNPASIEKTKNNIKAVNQREPGVILSDGRIVNGNRRFTCLRKLAEEDPNFCWFETIILNIRMTDSKKQIKMLELAIQHGEEKKVDYNPIDRLVGVYQDIVKTRLLTIEEYAESTNETIQEVKKRVENAKLFSEFLQYIGMPEQYYIAREYQVVSIFSDMLPIFKKCKRESDVITLKEAIFNNILMQTIDDSRKFIRYINQMMETNIFQTYLQKQLEITEKIKEKLYANPPKNRVELNDFINENPELAEELRNTLDDFILKAKKRATKSKPSQSVSKSFTILKDVDTRIFSSLSDKELESLTADITRLSEKVDFIKGKLKIKNPVETAFEQQPFFQAKSTLPVSNPEFKIADRKIIEPMLLCTDMNQVITTSAVCLHFRLSEKLPFQKNEASYRLFFLNAKNEIISQQVEITLQAEQPQPVTFSLSITAKDTICFLAVQSTNDAEDTLQQKIPFQILF